MKKFQTMGELISYMVGANAPNELKTEAEKQMQAVEETNQGGATAYLIIAESKVEAKQVEKEYALSNCAPEYSRIINTLDGAYWKQSVFVFTDDGGESWDNGNMWRKGKLIMPEDGRAVYQTETCVLNGKLTAFLTLHNGWFLDWDCRMFHSEDNGLTWYDGGKLPWFDGFVFMRGAVELKNGHIILPYQHYNVTKEENEALKIATDKKKWLLSSNVKDVETGVILSVDGGKTFEKLPPMKTEMTVNGKRTWIWSEPTVVELSDGRLAMIMRRDGSGRLYISYSSDEGKNWTEPRETDIPNPSNKPKLLRHSDGRIFLLNTPNEKFWHRYPLEVWVSFDDMKSWTRHETVMGDTGYYSYADGFIDEAEKKILLAFENWHDIFYAEIEI